MIGLLFTLRTHAATIWAAEVDEKKVVDMSGSQLTQSLHIAHPGNTLTRQATSSSIVRGDIRSSQLYQRIVGQTLQSVGVGPNGEALEHGRPRSKADSETMHVVPPQEGDEANANTGFHIEGLSDETNQSLIRHMTEIAATTSAVAAREATRAPHKTAQLAHTPKKQGDRPHHQRTATFTGEAEDVPPGHTSGGHDAPNWSRTKSAVILLTATLAYAIIAEILVSTVDAVLVGSDIDEKFLGITLFALVPNTTEFLVS